MSQDDTNPTNSGEQNPTNSGEQNPTNGGEQNPTNVAAGTDMEPVPRDAHGRRAVIAARDRDTTPDTTEISGLAVATGYTVVGEITQRRREDPTYGLGRGAAEDLMRLAVDRDADAVIYDGELSPGQTYSLGELLPAGVAVVDRPRLVMERFADAADSRAADRQLELARLRYELPRLREAIARDHAEEVRLRPEGDSRVLDVERRIQSAERALDDISGDRAARRARRREAGFDLVALAGYTNAGKSRLCRRLADDVDGEVETEASGARAPSRQDAPSEQAHADLDSTLATGDRPFETLSTTTHEATMDGRRTLVTDTVGFVDDLPHDAIRSFRATIDAVREADCVLLVVDASEDPSGIRQALHTSLSAIEATNGPVVPVLNKVDRLDAAALETVAEAVEAVVETLRGDDLPVADALLSPVPTSARDGTGVSDLTTAVADALPTATATVEAPNGGKTESALSWAYDRGVVMDVRYATDGDGVTIELAGRPAVVEEATRRFDSS